MANNNQVIDRIRELALQHEVLDKLYTLVMCLEDDEMYTKRDASVSILEVAQIIESNMVNRPHPDELRETPVACELQVV